MTGGICTLNCADARVWEPEPEPGKDFQLPSSWTIRWRIFVRSPSNKGGDQGVGGVVSGAWRHDLMTGSQYSNVWYLQLLWIVRVEFFWRCLNSSYSQFLFIPMCFSHFPHWDKCCVHKVLLYYDHTKDCCSLIVQLLVIPLWRYCTWKGNGVTKQRQYSSLSPHTTTVLYWGIYRGVSWRSFTFCW